MKVILTETEKEYASSPSPGLLLCELEIVSWLSEDIARDEKLNILMKLIPSIHNRYDYLPCELYRETHAQLSFQP